MTTIDDIRERLSEIRPLGFPHDVVAARMVRGIHHQDGVVAIVLEPPALAPPILSAMVADIRRAVGALDGVKEVNVELGRGAPPTGGARPGQPAAVEEPGPLPGIGDIIAVASTKGGVGKSTVAANLALALHRLGRRVGLLDADVYGPSVPIMFGASGGPRPSEHHRIAPLERYGLKLMSVGFFLDDQSPVIWRGPMVMGLVRQFLKDVEWGELDVLVVDLPPGTGDAQLTLVQQVPLAGGVVVTTPQDVATLDVQRGIAMFRKVNTPLLGIVENMSYYDCPKCGRREDVFGAGGGKLIAAQFGVPLLGQIPLLGDVRTGGDEGKPIVVDRPDHPISLLFVDIACRVIEAVDADRLHAAPPTIVV
ncbi:MAG: Mrp/NBP35 family ATP-binding protein [Candidatus Binatia bacterium]